MPTFDSGFDAGFDIETTTETSTSRGICRDKAFLGDCSLGSFRLGVTVPVFDAAKARLEKIPTPRRFTVDGVPSMVVDGVEARVDVFTDIFERVKKAVEK